ncbi:MAG: hypothetical protein R6U21_03545 [Thermoplasmatota archaeon]
MKNKIINCLNSLGFTLASDKTADRKIFVYDNILVSVEKQHLHK